MRKRKIATIEHAAGMGDLEAVKAFLTKGVSVDERSKDDAGTPLKAAAYSCHIPVLLYLLEQGADPNAVNENGYTALMAASRVGWIDVVDILLKNGADPNQESGDDKATAIHFAVNYSGRVEVVQRLLDGGADVHHRLTDGRTVLIDSVCRRLKVPRSIIVLLLEKGVSKTEKSNSGETAYSMALRTEQTELLDLLEI